MFNKYIAYEVDTKANTFGDLFNVKLTQSNCKANSCFVNALVNHFSPSFDELRNGIRRHPIFTYETLCDLLKIEDTKLQSIKVELHQALLKLLLV